MILIKHTHTNKVKQCRHKCLGKNIFANYASVETKVENHKEEPYIIYLDHKTKI